MSTSSFDKVKLARANSRPTGSDYIQRIFSGFFEQHGDRRFADDPAVMAGIAWLGELPVTVIAIDKGHTAKERTFRNFGAPHPEGYRKALRAMKQAEKFGRPVVCFVDTSGAYCGIGAEERGQGQAIAENLMEMMALKTPILSVLIGEGGSGGALALAAADQVWMLENAIYSVISPEGCASILWKNASRAPEASERLKLTTKDALAFSVVDRMIPERNLGSDAFFDRMKGDLKEQLIQLGQLTKEELTENRYLRFRKLGTQNLTGESQECTNT